CESSNHSTQEAAVTDEKQRPPIQVADDDPQMTAAIQQARANIDGFIAALSNPQPNQKAFSVKVAISDGDQTEHLWLVPVRFENGRFIGRINSEPQKVETVKFGEEIGVAKDKISDWIYAENRKMVGGFTARVLQGASNVQTKSIGNHELMGTWSVVSIDRGAGPDPKPGFHLTITDTEITFLAPNGATKTMGHLHRIDPKAIPREIDLRNGNSVGFGLYELDGDSLKMIVRNPGAGRPTELKGSSDSMLFTLKRD
ncbi:MAG: DUF2314 domain-containing protein, partial [Pirellulaceae bacterium]